MTREPEEECFNSDTQIDKELEDLKRKFIVDVDTYNMEQIKEHTKLILEHCKISPEGLVLIENKKLAVIDQIGLIILARYIANKLSDKIVETITPGEISDVIKLDNRNVTANVSRLVERRLVIKPKDGVYRFNPTKIEEFLNKLKQID